MSTEITTTKATRSIENALYSLMKEKPYADISVSEITKKAKLSRQSFYLNFSSKDDVLKRQFNNLFSSILLEVEGKKTETLEQLIETYTHIVKLYSTEFKIIAANNLGNMLGDVLVKRFVDIPPVIREQKAVDSLIEHKYINGFWIYAFIEVYTLWLEDNMVISENEICKILLNIMNGSYFKK